MKRILLLIALVFLTVCAVAQTTHVVLNESGHTYTSSGQGVNINTEDPFDSHILKNVIAGYNPSLQPQLNTYFMNVASVTVSTTTVVDNDTFSDIVANQYQGLTYYVACSAASNFPGSVQICNGASSSASCTGTVTSNTANTGFAGATFVLSTCAPGFNVHDSIVIGNPGGGQGSPGVGTALSTIGWSCATTGTGTCTIDTTGGNLYPGAVTATKMCNGSSGTVTLSTNVDTSGTATYNLIPINGTYTYGLFTNILSGSGMNFTNKLLRGSGAGGDINTSCTMSPTGSGWQTSSCSITGSEPGNATHNSLAVSYQLLATPGANSCVDVINAQLTNNADNNASLFNNAFITNFGATGGVTNTPEWRFSWPINNDTLTNLLAVQAVRVGLNPFGGTNQYTASLGLHDTLTAAKVGGLSDMWLSFPVGWRSTDWQNFVNYYCGTTGTYAALRISLGQTTPWCQVFKKTTIEVGNEEWNGASHNFIPGYSGCGSYGCNNYYPLGIGACGSMKTAADWNSSEMQCAVGVQTGNGSVAFNFAAQDTNNYVDLLAINQYLQGGSQTACTATGLYQPSFVQAYDAAFNASDPYQFHYTCTQGKNCGVYEGQKNPSAGNSCTLAQLVGMGEGQGYGMVAADYALEMNASSTMANMLHWNFFDVYGYGVSDDEALWGIFNTTNTYPQPALPHPAAYAMGLANTCAALGTGYDAIPGSPPTFNFASSNGVTTAYPTFALLRGYGFKNGSTSRCAVVINWDSSSHAIDFTGTNAPSSATVTSLTSTNVTDSNETSLVVQPTTPTSTGFPFTAPKYSINIFQFTTGTSAANTPTFSPVAGAYGPTQSVTISSTSSGAIICYNTTGSPVTNGTTGCTTGTLYTTPVSVASSETLYAVAGGTGFLDSSVGSAAYTINGAASTPTFSPVAGTYTGTQNVTISATNGPTICYSTTTTPATNGTTGCTTGTLYSGPVAVSVSETLHAIAGGTGWSDGTAATAAYTINAATGGISISGKAVMSGKVVLTP